MAEWNHFIEEVRSTNLRAPLGLEITDKLEELAIAQAGKKQSTTSRMEGNDDSGDRKNSSTSTRGATTKKKDPASHSKKSCSADASGSFTSPARNSKKARSADDPPLRNPNSGPLTGANGKMDNDRLTTSNTGPSWLHDAGIHREQERGSQGQLDKAKEEERQRKADFDELQRQAECSPLRVLQLGNSDSAIPLHSTTDSTIPVKTEDERLQDEENEPGLRSARPRVVGFWVQF